MFEGLLGFAIGSALSEGDTYVKQRKIKKNPNLSFLDNFDLLEYKDAEEFFSDVKNSVKKYFTHEKNFECKFGKKSDREEHCLIIQTRNSKEENLRIWDIRTKSFNNCYVVRITTHIPEGEPMINNVMLLKGLLEVKAEKIKAGRE